jgi:serine protease Do
MIRKHFCWHFITSVLIAFLWIPAQAHDRVAQEDLCTVIAQVTKQNIPAVVLLEVNERQEVVDPLLSFENDHSFRSFFSVPGMAYKFKKELQRLGTGMIIDKQGHILANNHVVTGATEIQVLLASGEQYSAKLVGTDSKTDLGVIKISAKDPFPSVTFGDSDKVKVGEWVVAIGYPQGLDQAVTKGIISAKHRRGIVDPSSYHDFLQTDAAINPCNSGGPLLNLQGEVIGVNAAIMSQSSGFEGIGFAIPSKMALHIAKQLIVHGKMQRGWLGVSVQDLTLNMAKSFGMEIPRGAFITDVIKEGPADEAGLRKGDVVIDYQGKAIADASTLCNEVAISPIGQEVGVTILRYGEKQEVTVRIRNLEESIKMWISSIKARLGADVRPVTSNEIEKYGLTSQQGIKIVMLDPNGPLGSVGFEEGDMILEIDGHDIEGLQEFVELVNTFRPYQRIIMRALDHRSGRIGYVEVVLK